MAPKFQLFNSPQSPYARKVVIAARILGLNDRIERLPTKPSEVAPPPDLISVNPLGKIPALVVLAEDGSREVVFDSSVILQYLDSIAEKRDTLYAPSNSPDRVKALNYEALADGVMDAAWLLRAETLRPKSVRSEQWIAGQGNKIKRGVEALAKLPLPEFPSVQAVVLACTLWYLARRVPDFRWQEVEGGKLDAWFKQAVLYPAWIEEGEVPPSHAVVSMRNFKSLIREVHRVLRPGGLLLFCEYELEAYDAEYPDTPAWGSLPGVSNAIRLARGVNIYAWRDLPRWLPCDSSFWKEIELEYDTDNTDTESDGSVRSPAAIRPAPMRGFTGVSTRANLVPAAPWPSDPRLREVGALVQDVWANVWRSIGSVLRVGGLSEAEAAETVRAAVYDIEHPLVRISAKLHTLYAFKVDPHAVELSEGA